MFSFYNTNSHVLSMDVRTTCGIAFYRKHVGKTCRLYGPHYPPHWLVSTYVKSLNRELYTTH